MRVLIAEDEEVIRRSLKHSLTNRGFIVEAFDSGSDAIVALENSPFHLALLDYRLPDITGLDIFKVCRLYDVPAFLMTGYADVHIVRDFMRQDGAIDFLPKPFDFDKLTKRIEKIREDRRAKQSLPLFTMTINDNDKRMPNRKLLTSAEVAEYMSWMQRLDREMFFILHLDAAGYVINTEPLAMAGSLVECPLDISAVFASCLRKSAAAFILCHNHCSNDPTPSEYDYAISERIKQASEIMGIPIIESLVISHAGWRSCLK